jgi:outer membrane receptor protein involved in Fe transport
MRSLLQLTSFVFILLILITSSHAGTTGKLVGNITDATTGEGLPGVNVIVENTTFGAATDLDGNYIIIGIPPGKYTIVASYISYRDMRVTDVEINIDKTRHVDIELQQAALELDEEIVIVAERPLFKKDLTSTESSVGKDVIETLPVENLDDVVNLQAGVVEGHFRGGRIGEVMYMVNGIPINDVYSGEAAINVENNAIQELNVISGTFNAEYGQAMSGVVNVVTKDGPAKYEMSLSTYGGSYLTSHDNIFWNPDITPVYNLQGTLGGPVPLLGNKLSFFASGRYNYDTGFIYAKDVFAPTDHSPDFNLVEVPEERDFMAKGRMYQFSEETAAQLIKDADEVAMNDSKQYSGNLKITFKPINTDKINYEVMYQNRDWHEYDHQFRLNPDGSYNFKQWSAINTLSWNHIFSANTFMDAAVNYLYTDFKQYVYDDLFDSRYVVKERLQDAGENAFATGGQQMWHFKRNTRTLLGKIDLTSQVTFNHLVKLGLEMKQHRLWMHEFEVIPQTESRIAPITSFQNNKYKHHPIELAAYLQDKMEYEDLVINAGMRFDYFDPDGEIPNDFENPDGPDRDKAEISYKISPRLGIAYPISATGAIHVSYGHFFQAPNFLYLYTNPEFDIDPLQSSVSDPPQSTKNIIGNANLKPQQTTIYELGIQQQIGDLYGISLTVFFKDLRNLIGTKIYYTQEGFQYARYFNRDYGFIRGTTLDFEKRYSQGFALNLDYTYQIAKGNASDPNTAFLDEQAGKQTVTQFVPLNWDRRHQINGALRLGNPNNFVVSVIGRYGTGMPYNPSQRINQPDIENGGRKPDLINVDLYLIKKLMWRDLSYSVFVKIYNLFDRLNEQDVFGDTGRATYTTEPLYAGGERPRGLNTLDDYFVRPNYYSAPRSVLIGLEIGL